MALFLVAGGLVLLILPGVTRMVGGRLAPLEWARASALFLAAGGITVEVGAVFLATPTVLRALGVHSLASACDRMLGPLMPGGPLAGWSAAAVAITLPTLALVGARRVRATWAAVRIEPDLGTHERFGGAELVTLPSDEVVAYTVPGRRGQIVVSDGLRASLSGNELQAVLRHELAHLHHRHHRHLLVAAAVDQAFALLAPVRRSTAVLRLGLERWADEWAAGSSREHRQVLRAALLKVTTALVTPDVAALSGAATIVARLEGLGRRAPAPSVRWRALLLTLGGVHVFALVLAAGSWASQARAVVALGGQCPL